jgi:hypothetical protein
LYIAWIFLLNAPPSAISFEYQVVEGRSSMDKDRAASLEGTMRGLRMLLEEMADYVRESFPEHQQQRAMRQLGNALGGVSGNFL